MENELKLDNTSLNFNNSLSKSYVSSQDIDPNYNYYWENSKSSDFSCSDSIIKQNELLERFLNNKRANFFSILNVNKENKNAKNTGFESNSVNNKLKKENYSCKYVNEENKSKCTSAGGKAFSNKLAFILNKQSNGNEASIGAFSVKNKLKDVELKLRLYQRRLSHDTFLVKNNNAKKCKKSEIELTIRKNKIFDELYFYFYNTKSELCDKTIKYNKPKNTNKSFDFGNKIFMSERSNGTDVTRKISNILYNLIANNDNFPDRHGICEESKNNYGDKEKTKSKFDSMDKLANLINSERKRISADNIIGPTPNIKEIKKNYAFNKSYDSFDVQSEFLISYLRDEDLLSEANNESMKNTESNKAEEDEGENDNVNKINENKNADCNDINNFKYNNNQRTNYAKNKNFQEKVFLNINNKYSKTLQTNKTDKNKTLNFKDLASNNDNNINILNKKLETTESFNNENNNNKENQKCCFFRCKSSTYNNNININNLNPKINKRKKQDANVNSYYSTINNTKRSTNHSFKSIRLNDSLTKFRKRRLSNCASDRDSKCPTKASNSNLVNFVNANYPSKKEKKVNCRCEIF